MITRFLYSRLPFIWSALSSIGMQPLLLRLGPRHRVQPPRNKVSERADLRIPSVLDTYTHILRGQRDERAMVRVAADCALPGELAALEAAYWGRTSHNGPAGASRRLWPEGRWEYAWVAAHLDLTPGMTVLDVGTENSFLPLYLAAQGCDVTGVDAWFGSYGEYFREQVLARCVDGRFQLEVRGPGGATGHVTYLQQDAMQLTLPGASFDRVVSISVIEHIPDDSAAIREMARVLKPGGLLALTTPFGPAFHQTGELHHKDRSGRWTGDMDRVYTPQALQERLVGPSGLTLFDQPAWEIDWRQIRKHQMVGEPTDHATVALFLCKS